MALIPNYNEEQDLFAKGYPTRRQKIKQSCNIAPITLTTENITTEKITTDSDPHRVDGHRVFAHQCEHSLRSS